MSLPIQSSSSAESSQSSSSQHRDAGSLSKQTSTVGGMAQNILDTSSDDTFDAGQFRAPEIFQGDQAHEALHRQGLRPTRYIRKERAPVVLEQPVSGGRVRYLRRQRHTSLAIPSRVEESLVDTIEGLQQAKTSRLEIKRKVSVFQVGKEFYVAIDQYAKQKEGVIKQVQESSSSNNSHSSSSAASNDSKNEKLEDAPQAMNCIAVVDASSSMSGPRIKIVEKALLACLQDPGLLSTWSRMGIVLFDQRASIFYPLKLMNENNRNELVQKLDPLKQIKTILQENPNYEGLLQVKEELQKEIPGLSTASEWLRRGVFATKGLLEDVSQDNFSVKLPLIQQFLERQVIPTEVGTHIQMGLSRAIDFLQAAKKVDEVAKISIPSTILLLSDGDNTSSFPSPDEIYVSQLVDTMQQAGLGSVSICTVGIGKDHKARPLQLLAGATNGEFAAIEQMDAEAIQRLTQAFKKAIKASGGMLMGESKLMIKGIDGASVGPIWHQGAMEPTVSDGVTIVDFPPLGPNGSSKIIGKLSQGIVGKLQISLKGIDLTTGEEFASQEAVYALQDAEQDPLNILHAHFFEYRNTLQEALEKKEVSERRFLLLQGIHRLPAYMVDQIASLQRLLSVVDAQEKNQIEEAQIENAFSQELGLRFNPSSWTKQQLKTHEYIQELEQKGLFVRVRGVDVKEELQRKDFFIRNSSQGDGKLVYCYKDITDPEGFKELSLQVGIQGELVIDSQERSGTFSSFADLFTKQPVVK